METRICNACNTEKPITKFEKRGNSIRKTCMTCRSRIKRENILKTENGYWKLRIKDFNSPNIRYSPTARNTIANSPKITTEEVLDLIDKEESKCHYCKVKLEKEQMYLDHANPLSKGGAHHINNIRVSCNDCNQLKGARTEQEFINFLKEYLARFNQLS